ncbi:hypothetical protein LIER_05201 [Lithospermum erythrorhizon]|uniref:Uncharacterized protein n=1 Tax=Lithospermum erythrorhizon TaxID=34254 RepID=A0AAV3P174_LITER
MTEFFFLRPAASIPLPSRHVQRRVSILPSNRIQPRLQLLPSSLSQLESTFSCCGTVDSDSLDPMCFIV